MTRTAASLAILLLVAGCTEIVSALAPQAQAIEDWGAHDPTSAASVDHTALSAFLERFSRVEDGIRRVDYGAAAKAREPLDRYVASLLTQDPRALNREEQLAYWINLYNAETIRVVLDHYPVQSIQDIDLEGGGLFGGPWGAPRLNVADRPVTLNDIEHGILRPHWQDPRIHYALNCASLGCPNVAVEAYTAATAEALLEAQAREFVGHPRGVLLKSGEVRLSSIYQWYRKDFGQDDAEVLAHVRTYAKPELQRALSTIESIDGYDYDWRLNAPGIAYP